MSYIQAENISWCLQTGRFNGPVNGSYRTAFGPAWKVWGIFVISAWPMQTWDNQSAWNEASGDKSYPLCTTFADWNEVG